MAHQTMAHSMTHSVKTMMAVSAATLLSVSAMAQNKALLFKEQGALDKAKTEIDNNVNDPKLANKAKTWVARAQIYEALANDTKAAALDSNAAMVAYDSYKKALEVEPNGKMTKEVTEAMNGQMLYSAMMNQGIRRYQAKNFDDAYTAMTLASTINAKDTTAPMYAGISAQQAMSAKGEGANRADYMTKTKQQFEKYAENGGRDVTIWASLAQMYNSDKEVDKALGTLDRAMKLFPSNRDLGTTRVSILQSSGRMDEAITSMKELYEKNPSDAQSAVNLGIMYDNNAQNLSADAKKATDEAKKGAKLTKKMADEKAVLDTYMSEIARLTAAIKKQPKSAELKRQLGEVQGRIAEQKGKMAEIDKQMKEEASKGVDAVALQTKATELTKKANETKAMARDYYKKALAADANNFEANFNTGVGIFNDAVEMKSEVDNMSMAEYSKSGKEVEGRVCGKFKQALPYFQKAKSVNANDSVLNSTLEQVEGILKQFEEKKVACVTPGN
ncbi:tetratricopeptide repeat protein [Fibrella aquatica]|jgi:tetratricopeptide (TPR) repeat protein|uniref:tetratricopeptide repeat protein n=1 Tax=Fibrella aquatica TaxID=3242487 RepID=UPI0035217B01